MRRLSKEEFNPKERAYPFEDGWLAPGIEVTERGVAFTGQRGPIGEVGINGCQIDDMVRFCRETIAAFNEHFPCRENSLAITKLDEALLWLSERKRLREERGVEGTNQPLPEDNRIFVPVWDGFV